MGAPVECEEVDPPSQQGIAEVARRISTAWTLVRSSCAGRDTKRVAITSLTQREDTREIDRRDAMRDEEEERALSDRAIKIKIKTSRCADSYAREDIAVSEASRHEDRVM